MVKDKESKNDDQSDKVNLQEFRQNFNKKKTVSQEIVFFLTHNCKEKRVRFFGGIDCNFRNLCLY